MSYRAQVEIRVDTVVVDQAVAGGATAAADGTTDLATAQVFARAVERRVSRLLAGESGSPRDPDGAAARTAAAIVAAITAQRGGSG